MKTNFILTLALCLSTNAFANRRRIRTACMHSDRRFA